jgi:septum formation protein
MINFSGYQFILASRSPRRQEFLRLLGINFKVDCADVQEIIHGNSPLFVVHENARLKALGVAGKYSGDRDIVIGADTIVHRDNHIWGKPDDIDEARDFLLQLENGWHQVTTAVCLLSQKRERLFHVTTDVHFTKIDKEILDTYIKSADSLDKAGGYGIQGGAQMFIDRISGSYSNVVGFPVAELIQEIREFVL